MNITLHPNDPFFKENIREVQNKAHKYVLRNRTSVPWIDVRVGRDWYTCSSVRIVPHYRDQTTIFFGLGLHNGGEHRVELDRVADIVLHMDVLYAGGKAE